MLVDYKEAMAELKLHLSEISFGL